MYVFQISSSCEAHDSFHKSYANLPIQHAVLLSVLPSLGINAYITKEQKKASRVADMLAIDEMADYRHFADYSRFK